MPFGRHPLKMVCLPISPLPQDCYPCKYNKCWTREDACAPLSGLEIRPQQSLHPLRQSPLVRAARGLCGMHICALLGGSILAELEFAFDARDGNAKADDAREHGAAKAVGHRMPAIHECRLICGDKIGEKRIFTGSVVDQRERAVKSAGVEKIV